jgi:hypothetical protein
MNVVLGRLLSVIFHCEPSKPDYDSVRIYLRSNRGIHMQLALKPSADLENMKPPKQDARWGIGIPGKVNPGYYPYKDYATPGTNDVIEFLEGLSGDKARRLAMLSITSLTPLVLTPFTNMPAMASSSSGRRRA